MRRPITLADRRRVIAGPRAASIPVAAPRGVAVDAHDEHPARFGCADHVRAWGCERSWWCTSRMSAACDGHRVGESGGGCGAFGTGELASVIHPAEP